MKYLLAILTLACGLLSTHAANPSFGSFDTNDFLVMPSIAHPQYILLKRVGTNIYETIIVTNLTVINNITLNGTNVAALNPTIGRYPYNLDGTNFGDGSLRYVDPTTSATPSLEVDDLQSGGFVISLPTSGLLTNVPFVDVALWTNKGGILQPVDLALPVEIDSQINFGPGATNSLYRYGLGIDYANPTSSGFAIGVSNNVARATFGLNGAGYAAITSTAGAVSLGGHAYITGNLDLVLPNSTELIYGYNDGVDYSRLAISHPGTNGYAILDSQSSGIAGEPVPISLRFNNTNLFTFNELGQLNFGPTVNRYLTVDGNGQQLDWQSPGTFTGFVARDGSSDAISMTVNSVSGDGQFLTTLGTVGMGNASHMLWLNNTRLYASPVGTDLGWEPIPFGNLWMNGTEYISGYESALVNYSRLAVSHTGTNGAVVFSSQAAGIAGNPRRMEFDFPDASHRTLWLEDNRIYMNLSGSPYGPQEFGPNYYTQSAYVSNTVPTVYYGVNLLTSFNATSDTPGYSPGLNWIGTGWSTNNAGIEQVRFSAYVEPIAGLAHPDGTWKMQMASNELSPHFVFGVTGAGAVLLNPMTKAQKATLTPAEGMIVFQSDNTPGLRVYESGAWRMVSTVADP